MNLKSYCHLLTVVQRPHVLPVRLPAQSILIQVPSPCRHLARLRVNLTLDAGAEPAYSSVGFHTGSGAAHLRAGPSARAGAARGHGGPRRRDRVWAQDPLPGMAFDSEKLALPCDPRMGTAGMQLLAFVRRFSTRKAGLAMTASIRLHSESETEKLASPCVLRAERSLSFLRELIDSESWLSGCGFEMYLRNRYVSKLRKPASHF